MLNLFDTVRGNCADLPLSLVETHFRRMSPVYFERFSPAEIARHVRLLSGLVGRHTVDVEIRPLASRTFEVLVVGVDYPGTIACITAALAAYGFDIEDVQVASYLDAESAVEPRYFVIVLRTSGGLSSRSLAELTAELRERLRIAFAHLSEGKFLEAHTAAADTRLNQLDAGHTTPQRSIAVGGPRQTSYEGMLLGGDFSLQRKLATGGMSEVYLATQVSLNRTVAVKVFRHEGTTDDELLERFNREAVVLGQFSCAHIVQILAAGTLPDRTESIFGWMAMEYMAGGDLAGWLRQKGSPPTDLGVRWLRQALEGLHYAHRHGIVHRDLKPHNLLLTAEGDLKVSDFGLLKRTELTMTGLTPRSAVLGTPQYMSPEQALGEALDERSDIFSLGTAFFHILAGQLPFQKNSATALLVQITQEDAPRLGELAPQVPAPVTVIITRMMARRREERYQDVGVILEDLASYERRGLLKFTDTSPFLATEPVATRPGEETQAYQPAAGEK